MTITIPPLVLYVLGGIAVAVLLVLAMLGVLWILTFRGGIRFK